MQCPSLVPPGVQWWAFFYVHFLYLFVLGVTAPGQPAMKRRQRENGRTYKIPVDRPRIIEDYNKNMGYVDRHNRF